jgi:hypothetical protein
MKCRCGCELVTSGRREVCASCGLVSRWCRCVPAVIEPVWRKWTREHDNAKELAAA